jgi:Holliday junction resolvase-like predicted endonuclease
VTRAAKAISGHAAEHFVCYDLARRGLFAANNPFEGGPYDIIADHNGRLLRIQVKSTAEAYVADRVQGKKKWTINAYQFHVKQKQLIHSDLVAFVALDIEKIIYRTPESLKKNSTGIEFSPAIMSLGCDKSLTELLLHL